MKNMLKVLGMFVATLFVANVALALNDVDIDQVGDSNSSITTQTGNLNDIDVDQESVGGTNVTHINQDGDSNTVGAVTIDGASHAITAAGDTIQESRDGGVNTLNVDQTGGTNTFGNSQVADDDNTANVVQTGGDTMASLQFSHTSALAGDNDNDLTVDQLGGTAVSNFGSNHQSNPSAGNEFTLCQGGAVGAC